MASKLEQTKKAMGNKTGFWNRIWGVGYYLRLSRYARVRNRGYKLSDFALRRRIAKKKRR